MNLQTCRYLDFLNTYLLFIFLLIYFFFFHISDTIQCTGATLVEAVRADARTLDRTGNPNGDYYALHIRRGDFQYKVSGIMITFKCIKLTFFVLFCFVYFIRLVYLLCIVYYFLSLLIELFINALLLRILE